MDANTSSSQPQHAGAGSQIRSRVTVVCAECKRLKLKCDRRTPCSSCLKRDTVLRCTYSAAATEKIDIQSLHNRVLVIESHLAQVRSGKVKLSSHDMDHALLAVGASGSSVLVPMDDVAGIWLERLDLGRDSGVDLLPVFPSDLEGHPPLDYLGLDSSPCSHLGSMHSSPHPSSKSASASAAAAAPGHFSFADTIPPTFLASLPPAQQRPALLDTLGLVLRMHPSLNFLHFRARINAMFTDGTCSQKIGTDPPHVEPAEKPTLSFFAAAAAGFALAVQCSPPAMPARSAASSHESSSSSLPSSLPSVMSLLALSTKALDLAETSAPYDLDFVHGLVLRCLCLLHDGTPRVNQAVFANLGKMVNITRMMGLARDPDEFPGKYTLWEAEMRRRMWWDVFYYDVFISDFTGYSPLLTDDQYTCRMPADVDEDAFLPQSVVLPPPSDLVGASNTSYFVQKCKLAQLVKNTKKRAFLDHSSSSPSATSPAEPSIDAASQAESDIHQYLSDLPPAFKFDIDADPTDASCAFAPSLPSPSTSDKAPPYLIIQRCELVTMAHQLLLKLFHPFLRRPNVRPPDVALFASINAAHVIINASRIARSVWQGNGSGRVHMGGSCPSTNVLSSHGVFYSFARQLFDAAIIAADVVIQVPQSVVAKVALEDVRMALEILRDPTIPTGRGRAPSRGGGEGCPSEAVTIVEMMLRKAEMAKQNHVPVSTGTKRKHEGVETTIAKGFWLPYVGTGVATESAARDGSAGGAGSVKGRVYGPPKAKPLEKPFAPENQRNHHAMPHRVRSASATTRERDRDRKYPTVGIRNRVNTGHGVDHKAPVGVARPRREPSVLRPQPPSGDPGGYATRAASTSRSATSMPPEPMRISPTDFHLSAPYGMEDAPMVDVVDVTVPPTTSSFTPESQANTYTMHSFQPTGVSGPPHQPVYDSNSYASDPSRQQPQSFYVPYGQSTTSTHSTYQSSLGGPGHMHSHSHASQQPQLPHLEIPPHMGLLPNQNDMDTLDPPRVAKEEGADRHDSHSHATGSQFPGPERWTDAGVAAGFAGPPSWEPGFGNF